MQIDQINKCLRSELSAVETYHQALEKERGAHGRESSLQQLDSILNDHQEAVSQIKAHIQSLGGTPEEDSGAWGTWSQLVMGTAKLLGDKTALKALKEGEENGLKDYQELLSDAEIPRETADLFNGLRSKQQTHIRTLDNLMRSL